MILGKTKTGTSSSNLDRTSGKTAVMATATQVPLYIYTFVMYISGTKFEEHGFNISRDILKSISYHFSGTVYYVITFLISIIQKC